ncbi:four helix bundle protein [Mesoflavibacter sp. CH_XMU1404-2]|uniref:four helix bundle protein n=1 Tax=Mesoflavibacter sp. CH_XMU1404-2 TaxID=3107766 RepID=UPI00243A91A8|tara:strand:+ start:222 stop:581 length:360 start_codon:yes stop_codon:yes gene_type:complete
MRRHNFKNLQIWQESINLITDNYNFTATLPKDEKFGLISQLNRSCVSIASNIAEGTSKRSNKHFIKYLEDSLGSAYEWETQIIICKNLNFISEEKFDDFENRIKKIQQKISNFIDKLDN